MARRGGGVVSQLDLVCPVYFTWALCTLHTSMNIHARQKNTSPTVTEEAAAAYVGGTERRLFCELPRLGGATKVDDFGLLHAQLCLGAAVDHFARIQSPVVGIPIL